ncbi:MAG: hypothetical protein JW993_06385 [Sedimentisphaerales bacterium]|nr:hypothetical protein [Sedimentisphaerales bacterium]
MKLMKRWVIGIVVCVLVLVALAALVIQVVLLTDLPRRVILQAAADQTGLDVQAESVAIRWSGRTTIRKPVVRMPLSDREFFTADAIELSHTSVPVLLITRAFRLRSVRIARPHAFLWQDEQGRWNVQNVADRVVAVAGSSEQSDWSMTLPNVGVEGGLIELAEPNGPGRTVGPLAFQGIAEKGSVWRFALQGPDGAALHGEVAQGGNWAHRVEFVLEPNAVWLQTLMPEVAGGIQAAGRWDGRVERNGLRGMLRLDPLRAGPVSLAGTVSIATQANGVTLSPEGLVLNEPNLLGETIRLAGGKIEFGAEGLAASAMGVRTETTAAQLNGRWDFDARLGECTATWAGRLPGQEGEHSGTMRAVLRSPVHGLKEAQLTATADAQTALGGWRVAVQTQGAGSEWDKSLWRTSVGQFTWTRGTHEIDLSGAAAEVAVDGPQLRLAFLSLPNAGQVNAEAELNRQSWQWTVRLDARDIRLSGSRQAGLDIRLHGAGDTRKAAVSELRVAEGQTVVTGKGELSVPSREIHDAHFSARWPDRAPVPNVTQPAQAPARGQWTCQINVAGTAQPLALDTSGTLTGRDVRLGKRKVAQLEVPVLARVDTERVEIATSPFVLLGGRWQLSGKHELADPQTELHLTIQDLSLQTAAEMAGSPIHCQGQATAQLQLSVPGFHLEKALAFGNWDVTDLDVPPFEAQSGNGRIRIADGLVRFDEIQLVQGQGQARGAMQFRLDQPGRLSIKFALTDWPLRWESQPAVLVTDSEMEAQLDLLKQSLDGQGRLASRLLLEEQEFGRMEALLRVRERTLEIDELKAELLGGSAEGSARVPLDRPTGSTGQLQWHDLQPNQLAPWWPQAARAGGRCSGSLKAVQTDERARPLEPLRIDIQGHVADGRFGTAQVRDYSVVAYLGSRRFLIDESTLHLLGGAVNLRARVSPHAGQQYLAVTADVNSVDLNQIAHLTDPNAAPVVGRLSGRGTLLTSADWRRLSGQADLSVTQSDLVNNPIVRTLYDAMSLNLGQTKPEGNGQIDVLFDGTRVRIPSFVYFNRGVEIRGAGTINDFGLGAASPVEGYAVGSTRVLKGVQLPGVRQLDRLMSSMQASVASVTIGGTVGQTKVTVVPLPVVGEAFRGLLWRQLREQE